jgi:hypothetical protein
LSVKDGITFDHCLDFTSKRNMSLMGSGKPWNNWSDGPLKETNQIENWSVPHVEQKTIDLFYCLLYSYISLNGLILDNKVPLKWLQNSFFIYDGCDEYFTDTSFCSTWEPEFSILDTKPFFLSKTPYHDSLSWTKKKYYLEFRKGQIDFYINILKDEHLIIDEINGFYFINDKTREFVLNQYKNTRKFNFPVLSQPNCGLYINYRNADYQSKTLFNEVNIKIPEKSTLFDIYWPEYLDYCHGNTVALDYRSFSEYQNTNPTLNYAISLSKYQESLLLLYSYMDFNCTREMFRNQSIYYHYDKDWNYK